MSQVTTGVRAPLSLAAFYDFVQNSLGAGRYRAEIARRYIGLDGGPELRVLDVGCGTAKILDHLPPCKYVGIDFSDRYLESARRRYGDRATFVRSEASGASFEAWAGQFDRLIMLGLLHHLDDAAVVALFRSAAAALAEGGRVITADPTISPETHPIGRFLAARDRGRNVRPPSGYVALAREAFDDIIVHVHHDLLRVPYSHVILECSRPSAHHALGLE
jgi:SAM-dependent methyltransferase